MKHQLVRIAPHQAGKIAAAIYGLLSLCIVPIFWVAMRAVPGSGKVFGGIFIIIVPILYACIGYVFAALSAMTYNFVVKYVGGMQFEVETETAL